MLNLIDESHRECLMIRPERSWSSAKVIEALADVMVMKGVPEHIRSDNGPEFVARDLRKWLATYWRKTLYIEPGSPWENGYCESFNSKLRDEFSEWRDLLLDEGVARAGRALARPLQHRASALFAGISTAGATGCRPQPTRGMEKWKAKTASHFSTPPTATATELQSKPLRYTNNLNWCKRSGRPLKLEFSRNLSGRTEHEEEPVYGRADHRDIEAA
jgi:hypothetical protein